MNKLKLPPHNQQGSAIINALVFSVVISILALFIAQESVNMIKTLHVPRIKAMMYIAQNEVTARAVMPSSYVNCDSQTSNSCTLAGQFVAWARDRIYPISGCVPQTAGDPCGVVIGAAPWPAANPLTFNAANRALTVEIRYLGTEFRIAPITFTVNIPMEILQTASFACPASTPLFRGFDTVTGGAICLAIPQCIAGEYMTGFSTSTLQPTCRSLGNPPINCPGELIGSLSFAGGYSGTCVPYADPILYYGSEVSATTP